MSKAILFPVHPKQCVLIVSGEQSILLCKRKPRRIKC